MHLGAQQLQLAGDITAGRSLMHGNRWQPTPLTQPRREGQHLFHGFPA